MAFKGRSNPFNDLFLLHGDIFRIQPLRLSHLHRNSTIFISEICNQTNIEAVFKH